ncbi:unnamed protein product [Peronospora destructor]|uniref:Uncharacterized protein n=1 Tax=Peronospora destructor TaxID=86335 RepID=A0AAV0TA32_9STRA|nr:unnamed protein product [Peronospora destructor]
MRLFTGLLVVALAVTSSYADKTKNLRVTVDDDELDETASEGSHKYEISDDTLAAFLNKVQEPSDDGSMSVGELMKMIGDGSDQASLKDVLLISIDYVKSEMRNNHGSKKNQKDSFTQTTDIEDDDLWYSKSKSNTKDTNVKGFDTEFQESEDTKFGKDALQSGSGQLKSDTNVKENFTEDESDEFLSEPTTGKGGKDNTQVKFTDDELWGPRNPSDVKNGVDFWGSLSDSHDSPVYPKSAGYGDDDLLSASGKRKSGIDVGTETDYKSSINTKERLDEDDDEDQKFSKSISKPKTSVSGEEDVKEEMQVETEEDDEDAKSSKKTAP